MESPSLLSRLKRSWDADQLVLKLLYGWFNGNLLQCSCLENPRDGGALWAAVYGVAQGRTRLTRLSSSSNNSKSESLQLFCVALCYKIKVILKNHE